MGVGPGAIFGTPLVFVPLKVIVVVLATVLGLLLLVLLRLIREDL